MDRYSDGGGMFKEFMEQPVPLVDAGLYVSDGWRVIGEPWMDGDVRMVMLRKRFRNSEINY